MPLSTSQTSPLQPPNPDRQRPPLAESRELGSLLPQNPRDGGQLTSRSSPFAKSWAHLIAGGLGGMASATLTAPLDVLKTRLQSTYYQQQLALTRRARGIPPPETMPLYRSSLLHIRETFQILFAVPRAEGWRALFKGLGPNLIGVVPARSINFYVYGNGKRLYSEWFNDGQEGAWVHCFAAITAGIVTGTATNPIWVVKTRLQLDRSEAAAAGGRGRQYKNALDCTMKTLRYEGIRGLYRGLTASFLGVSESTMQWVLYEQAKKVLRRRQASRGVEGYKATALDQAEEFAGNSVAAGSAKTIAALITYPHEVVRTRLRQAPMQDGQLKYTGLWQCFRLIFKEEGLMAFYGGLTPHMLRVVPSAAIMFGVYEAVLRALGASSAVGQ